ncbi:hypothetical protein CSOJ01_11038 [Colletotrichum sojae]|uniref:Uncharacterized protein n=1 Tax=Colletotrichum sojae TaxID=2175907 RepID=A0A8H6MP82_9PEZI|nr:hypothetical protein CSOJ01_11038 [Colletotrichum sojae]
MIVAHTWRRVSMPSEKSRLTISSNIWACFMKLEGVAYISSLRNSPDDRHNLLIFAPDPASPIKKIYLGEDYLGVIKTSFRPPESCRQGQPDFWWRMVSLESSTTVVRDTNSLKVRRIVSDDKAAADNNGSASILWAAPPPRIPRLIQLEKSHPSARMATFVCNDPGVIAYWVHFNLRITSIHAHTSEEDLAMFKSRPASIEHRGLWQYFPLHSGEKITEIWVRGSQWLRVALIFKTSHDRVVVFGQHETIKPKTRLFLMDRPYQEKPSRIFFEESNSGVRAIANETPRPRVSPEYTVDLPQPTRNLVKSTAPVPWYYWTACLRGIKEIVPSQRCKSGWRKVIFGLLLRYYDGRRACLGQVRLDSLMTTLEVGGHPSFWLETCEDNARFPFVMDVGLSSGGPCNLHPYSEVEIRTDDSVDWWFSYHHSRVYPREDKS